MKKLNFFFLFFIIATTYGQYNEGAPWVTQDTQEKFKQTKSLEQISNAFNSYWKGKDESKKGSGFKPYKRWENHWRNQLQKDGSLATPQMIWKSWEQKNQLSKSSISNWESIGPFSTNVKQGQGRVNTFIIDPNNPNTYYVGAPAGGLWRSTDSGIHWTPLTDHLPQIGISGIAIDENNSNIIYVATGDDDSRDTYSVGVLKSVDGGINWNKTGLDFSVTNAITNEIYIHPDDSNIIWVSSNQGFYKSKDGGASWSKNLVNNIVDFKLKPGDPNVVYAVSRSKFYKSTNGGDSFVLISTGLPETSGRFVIDVSPDNPEVVYVLSSNIDNTFQGLYKSIDSGNNFSKTGVLEDLFGGSTQAWYDMAITVNPEDADMVVVGVLDIWRSEDGGDTFIQKNRWWDYADPAYTHADIHFLRYFNKKLYAGTDGGIYESSNDADTFTDLTENLSISQYYKISTAKRNARHIVGGLQDNGGFGFSKNIWHQYHGGDGMDCVVDPNNENIYYGFSQFGGRLNVTFNGGQTEGGSIAEAPKEEIDEESDRGGNWVTPLVANQKGELYAGYSKLYKLTNDSWEPVSNAAFGGDLDNLAISTSNNNVIYASRLNQLFKSTDKGLTFSKVNYSFTYLISSVEINNQDENTVYLTTAGFDSNGQVFKSTNGGQTWENISKNLPNEPKLVIKHQNQSLANDLFVGSSISVYHTNDNMSEWEVFDTALPNAPVYDMEINIEDKLITVGTYGRGVFQSPIEVFKANSDISLLSINTNNSVQCNGITPVITVKNNGLNNISNVRIKYMVDQVPYEFNYTGNIFADQIKEIELPNNPDIMMGDHKLNVEVSIENDTFNDNNVLFGSFTSNLSGEGQYVNTFGDVNQDEWLTYTLGTSNNLWEKSEATSVKFKNKLNSVYVTNANGNYSDETTAYLISPCYDLSRLENPLMRFDMVYDIELNWDVLYLEYTIDNGGSWHILGTADDPNWYNSDFIDPQRQITVGKQWTGTDTEVKEYSYPLAELSNQSNVIFRFVFASDQAENGEGVAIDNFSIAASAILAADDFNRHHFKLYPNPSSSVFYIQRPGIDEMRVSVYDVTGRLVYEKEKINSAHFTLDLAGVEQGLYFLKVIEGNKQLSTTILKQ
jgi:photosystem II stability/assembly factor-like uncharacterized protein